jgi:hypothetical protein
MLCGLRAPLVFEAPNNSCPISGDFCYYYSVLGHGCMVTTGNVETGLHPITA